MPLLADGFDGLGCVSDEESPDGEDDDGNDEVFAKSDEVVDDDAEVDVLPVNVRQFGYGGLAGCCFFHCCILFTVFLVLLILWVPFVFRGAKLGIFYKKVRNDCKKV